MGGQGSKERATAAPGQTATAVAANLMEQVSVLSPLPDLVPMAGALPPSTAEELLSTTASAAHAMRSMKLSASRVGFASTASMSDFLAQPNRQGTVEEAKLALKKVRSKDDMLGEFHARELAAAAFKSERAQDWCVVAGLGGGGCCPPATPQMLLGISNSNSNLTGGTMERRSWCDLDQGRTSPCVHA